MSPCFSLVTCPRPPLLFIAVAALISDALIRAPLTAALTTKCAGSSYTRAPRPSSSRTSLPARATRSSTRLSTPDYAWIVGGPLTEMDLALVSRLVVMGSVNKPDAVQAGTTLCTMRNSGENLASSPLSLRYVAHLYVRLYHVVEIHLIGVEQREPRQTSREDEVSFGLVSTYYKCVPPRHSSFVTQCTCPGHHGRLAQSGQLSPLVIWKGHGMSPNATLTAQNLAHRQP